MAAKHLNGGRRVAGLEADGLGWNRAIAMLYSYEFIIIPIRRPPVVKSSRPIAWVLSWALIGPGTALAAGTAPEPKAQEEDPIPLVNSPILTWQFNGSLRKVRDAMVALLKEDGLSIKEENRTTGSFVTDLVSFDSKKFGVDVSSPPPRADPAYPWLQSIEVNNGRFGLEGKLVAAGPETTRLDLRALIEVTAIYTKKGTVSWLPRYSNGTIEHFFFSRLGLKLLAPPPSDNAPR
jgi:hypothetical protein